MSRKCPHCQIGILVPRHSKFGEFLGCDLYPQCAYTEKPKKLKEESEADRWAREHGVRLDPQI